MCLKVRWNKSSVCAATWRNCCKAMCDVSFGTNLDEGSYDHLKSVKISRRFAFGS